MNNIIGTIITLLGGLGLFLHGMKLMGDGLENAAGDGLKKILEKVTSNPLKSVAVGAIVTAIIQSSSATTVMVVGFVNSGLMNLYQAAGIIMGANIGTTITAQLVSFKLDEIAPIFVFIGAVVVMFAKDNKKREIGHIILGFGILFTGMGLMSSSMKPLAKSEVFYNIIVSISGNWILGVLVGTILTAILQSSSATTGILIALAKSGTITINAALPIIFGCNIGTCITAIIASIGANKTAHTAAAFHLIFNILGTIIFLPFISFIAKFVALFITDVSREIANAHTVFNISNTIVLLPFNKYIISFVNKIVKGEDETLTIAPKYLDDILLETPVIAAGQVVKETIRMAEKTKSNLESAMDCFKNEDILSIEKIYETEKLINMLEEEITSYLVKLSKRELSDQAAEIVASTFNIINDIERIGDHDENIAELALEKNKAKVSFTDEAMDDIFEIYEYTIKALEIAITCYANKDVLMARSIYNIESKIDLLEKRFRENNIKRLAKESCNARAGSIFLDLLSNFERIGDHATNIADSVIENYT